MTKIFIYIVIFHVKSKFYYLTSKRCLKFQIFKPFLSKITGFLEITILNTRFFGLNCQILGLLTTLNNIIEISYYKILVQIIVM